MRRLFSALMLFAAIAAAAQTAKSKFLVPFRVKNSFGLSDTLGVMQVQPKFTDIKNFQHSLRNNTGHAEFIVKTDGKYYAIDENQQLLIPEKHPYDSIAVLSPSDKALIVYKDKKLGIYRGGEFAPCVYDRIYAYDNNSYLVYQNGKCGLINAQGKLIIDTQYRKIREDRQRSADDKSVFVWQAQQNGATQVFADARIPDDQIDQEFHDTGAPVGDAKYMTDAEAEIRKVYDTVKMVDSKLAIVTKKGKTGVYDYVRKKLAVPADYESIEFGDMLKAKTLFIVRKQKLSGFIDENNVIVEPIKYEAITNDYDVMGFVMTENGHSGIRPFEAKYPSIKPKYLKFTGRKSILVRPNREFHLYKVKTASGNSGLVGENGVEYFKD